MKLENIYSLCKKHYDIIEMAELEKSANGYVVNEADAVRYAIKQLSQVECLKESLDEFLKNFENARRFRGIVLSRDESIVKYNQAKMKLVSELDTIINLCQSMNLHTKELPGIDIKIPDTSSFADFKKTIDELDFIITKCPFFQHKTESLRFTGVDVGSQWMSFVVSGIAVATAGSILLNNIAAFIDKCIIIRSHYLTTQMQKQDIERAKLEQKQRERLINNIEEIYKVQVEIEIKELEGKTGYEIVDGDERGRVDQSIQKTGDLIDKGLQIVASIDTKQETKALFEPLEMKYLSIENKLKAIEDKKGKENQKGKNEN